MRGLPRKLLTICRDASVLRRVIPREAPEDTRVVERDLVPKAEEGAPRIDPYSPKSVKRGQGAYIQGQPFNLCIRVPSQIRARKTQASYGDLAGACRKACYVPKPRIKPTSFITMKASPAWDEITAELLPGQGPQDRSDTVARVFGLKTRYVLY